MLLAHGGRSPSSSACSTRPGSNPVNLSNSVAFSIDGKSFGTTSSRAKERNQAHLNAKNVTNSELVKEDEVSRLKNPQQP
jgi:hypothetical protein